MKIVGPTFVEPWREQIEGARTLKRLRELLQRLHQFRVLDPACGCGNFLYIAYRELKRLEARIYERMAEFASEAEPGQMRLSFLSAQNFYGLDILPFAVETAKVTMMIARKLAIDELHITEPALPFGNLDKNFIAADALLTPEGLPAQWPKADVIIGNPPYLDARKMTIEYGREYVGKLEKIYPEVPRRADFCTYWFRKAADHLPACTADDPVAGRAGLVGTQNIRNNKSRVGGLDYVVKTGTIVEAVENQPWSGEANVHVSIANWVKTQDAALLPKTRKLWFKVEPSAGAKKLRKRGSGSAAKEYELDVRECDEINSALSDETDVSGAKTLQCNLEPPISFNGQMLGHKGFLLTAEQRAKIISTDQTSKEVIFPYLNGEEMLTGGTPDRFVLDFTTKNQLEAAAYRSAFEWVKTNVLPDRESKAQAGADKDGNVRPHHKAFLTRWWQLSFGRPELVSLIEKLPRYLVISLVSKRPIFVFVSSEIRPSNLLQTFVLADDYSFGVLSSDVHWRWFQCKSSKLTERFRFGEGIWNTFPWPQFEIGSAPAPGAADRALAVGAGGRPSAEATSKSPESRVTPKGCREGAATDTRGACAPQTIAKIDAVAAAARELRRVRAEALPKIKGGLRALYRTLELPGANPLKDAHAALDTAVLTTYGFNPKRDLLAQLLALNQAVAAKIENWESVTAPGVPKNYPDASKLVTVDCIQP